jgi:DNA-binding NarL/FixJ family response regulator
MKQNNIKDNVIRIFIAARSKQDWQQLSNLVGLMNGVEVLQQPHDILDTTKVVLETVPDVLILDVDLRQGQGVALLKRVHAQNPALAIIVVSFFSSPLCRSICEHAGGDYFLDKSTEFQRIPAIITSFAKKKYSNSHL